jgi:hypothetical protein
MSPVRGKKAKSASTKKSARPVRPAAGTRKGKPAKKAAPKAKAAAKGKAPATPERRHCIAVDPFGDPCQSAPRVPSKYCTIHSYLDR